MSNPYTKGAGVADQLGGSGSVGPKGDTGEQGIPGIASLVGDLPVSGTWTNATTPGATTTFDPAAKSAHITLSGSNLIATSDGTADYLNVAGTNYESTGKHYCEITLAGTPAFYYRNIGLAKSTDSIADGHQLGDGTNEYSYAVGGGVSYKRHNSALSAYGATYTLGDVISIVWDADAGTLNFWKNGVDQGQAYSGVNGSFRVVSNGLGAQGDCTVNFGASAFAYAPPVGYVGWGASPTVNPLILPAFTAGGDIDLDGHSIIGLPNTVSPDVFAFAADQG